MRTENLVILLAGAGGEDAEQVELVLRDLDPHVLITAAHDRDHTMSELRNGGFDLVFLDAAWANGGLPDIRASLPGQKTGVPLLIVTGADDNAAGADLVQRGADDYLLRGQVNRGALARMVRALADRRTLERALETTAEQYRSLLGSISDYAYTVFIENGVAVSTRHGPGCIAVTGYSVEEYAADPHLWSRMVHDGDRHAVLHTASQLLSGHALSPIEHRIVHKDGRVRWIRNTILPRRDLEGGMVAYDGIVTDITEQKNREAELRRAAYFDPLTGLPNRVLCFERLNQALTQARRYSGMVALLLLDLDRFKEINDTLGHHTGDLLLIEVAERLKRCVWEGDTVGRAGGDEFVMLFPGIRQAQDAAIIATKIIQSLSESISVPEDELFITTSIGISVFPSDGSEAETLVKFAEIAMYQAKAHGGGTYQFYAHTMNAEALRRLVIENHLRRALERDEFVLHYQPQVDLLSGRVTGTEALIRWRHPVLGMLFPREFIPAAEETGLIIPIGEWAVRTACAQNRIWSERVQTPMRVAINLSMRQFSRHDMTRTVRDALTSARLLAEHLDLELTESMVMKDAERTISTLRELKSIGVNVTIDDFGTGYSSLSYLKDLPLSALKLDQSFVGNLTRDGGSESISGAIIGLAHSLNLRVIAEGVETAEQLECLRRLKCDEVQGYLFSRPLPVPDLDQFLHAHAIGLENRRLYQGMQWSRNERKADNRGSA